MFPFTRLALTTGAFYLGVNIVLDVVVFGATVWKGGSSIFASRAAWMVFFGSQVTSRCRAWALCREAVGFTITMVQTRGKDFTRPLRQERFLQQ